MSADDRESSPEPKRSNDYDRGDKDRWIRDGRVREPDGNAAAEQSRSSDSDDDVDETRTSDARDAAVHDANDREGTDDVEDDADRTHDDDVDDAVKEDRTDGGSAQAPAPFGRGAKAVSGGWNGGGGYSDASVERHRPDDARPSTSAPSTGGGPIPNEGALRSDGATAGSQRAADASLERELLAQFEAAGHDAAGVVLSVRGGEVVLEGSVADAVAKRALEDLAHASRQVTACQNHLKVAAEAP